MDDPETLGRFKAELKAPFPFVSDAEGKVVASYDVKMPLLSLPKRYTFTIGEGRKILKVESGNDAIDPNGAIVACPLRKPESKPAAPDAGTK